MDLDLLKYRQMIGQKLRDQADKKVQIDKKVERGKLNNSVCLKPNMKPNIKQMVDNESDSDSGSESDIDLKDIAGGKFNFIKSVKKAGKSINDEIKPEAKVNVEEGGKFNLGKSFKKMGKSISKDVNTGAKIMKDTAIKTGASLAGKEAGEYLYSGLKEAGKSVMNYAPEIAEDAGVAVAENPELLLLAAGIAKKEKKVKKTHKVSDKEKKRHALVSKLMKQHGISLPEASKLIKSKNINY